MVRAAIEVERYRIGPRVKRLRLLLAKLETEPENPAAYPPPMPSAQPSLLLR